MARRLDRRVDADAGDVGAIAHAGAWRQRRARGADEVAAVHRLPQRRVGRRPGHHLQHQRHVLDGAAHRSGHRDGVPDPVHRVLRHESRRGPQSHHPAERGRDAQRSAKIGAVGQRRHAGGERNRAAARGSAAREALVVRVARAPEHRVPGVGAGRELGHVGLADHDGAGGAQAAHDLGVGVGHVVRVDGRAPRGAQPRHRRDVLDAHGHAGQRTHVLAVSDTGVEGAGVVDRARVQRDHGVQRAITSLDGGERVVHDIDGTTAAGGDVVGNRGGGGQHRRVRIIPRMSGEPSGRRVRLTAHRLYPHWL
ncbi:MAG: hypothetical protein U0P30_03915 [Vicinamibacterales bacterium]